MFITFEGIDGCGKTTQLNLLKDYLIENNKEVVLIREPGGTEFSEKIRDILLHSGLEMNSVSELMLFQAARADLTEKIIIPALNEGKFVLSDRFFDSTVAYQGYGRELDLDLIHKINLMVTGNLKPHITFYLKINLETSYLRNSNRKPDRIENSGDDFYKRLIVGFDEIAKSEPNRFFRIDAEREIDMIQDDIRKVMQSNVLF